MPSPVGQAVDRQVAVGVRLVVADLAPHALREHLGAAAGQRVQAGVHEIAEHLLVGHAVELGEERDLDRREALQVDVRPDPLEAAQQLQVVVPWQAGVQSVDDVHLGKRPSGALAQLAPGLLEAHRVGAVVARLEAREGAEQAARHADVGRLQPDVVVEKGVVAVPLLALAVREPADGEQVRGLEEADPVAEVQANAFVELGRDVAKPGRSQPCVHR